MESSDPAPQTGLEESMWEMGLGGESYPERPGKPDCIYYLRTGFCGYGSRCRFNHPPDRSAVPEERRTDEGEYPERAGQPVCQYYMRTGTCKFGSSCKYHHPRQGAGAVNPVVLNVYGYPLRPGEKECSYYMKRGQCKFGMTCKFHHPQPANLPLPAPTPVAVPAPTPVPTPAIYPPVQSPSAPPSQQYGVMAGNWTVARPPMVPGSYVQGPYGPMLYPPGVVPLPGWAPYPAPQSPVASSTAQTTAGAGQLYGFSSLSPSAPAYTGSFQPISSSIGSVGPPSSTPKEFTLPQRPGQPECQYYLKTGDCKFGLSCKYHHPLESAAAQTSSTLSPMGLPFRPGVPTCTYYAQHGVCKFGPTCRFDHPMGTLSYSPSASSLSDMPVAPYPVGSAIGTQAPSSSSSDLRAEVNKDSYTTASSTSTLNGSKLSKNGATGHESEACSSS